MTTNAAPEITAKQKQEWRTRERLRFDRGEYQRLPVFWTNELWWNYGVRDHDAYCLKLDAARRSGKYLSYSEPHMNHYAHVSTTDGAMVAFTENDAKGVADRQTRMKPGKYLTKFFGDVLTADQIRDLATKFSAEYAPQKLQFAADADTIEHVYTHGPSSCMSYNSADFQSECHPVRVYGDSDLQVAHIAPQADRITARAICWPAKKLYGRVYGDEHRIVPLLKEAGYTAGSMRGARVRLIQHDDDSDYIVMPYVDGVGAGEIDGDYVRLGSGDICTQPTCGLSRTSPEHRCEMCERGMTDDDAYTCEGVDGYICPGCEDTETVMCDRTGYRILSDDSVDMANGETWSQRAFARHGFTCPVNDTNHPRSEGVEMKDGDTWSQAAFDDGGFVCAGNGKNYSRAVLVVLADGALWSQEHFDDHGHTSEDGANVRNDDAPVDAIPYRCPDTLEMDLRAVASSFAVGARVRGGNYGGEPDWMTGLDGTIIQESGNAWLVKFDNARGQGHNQDDACWFMFEHEMSLLCPTPLRLQDAA
jgi:hypothetical protein